MATLGAVLPWWGGQFFYDDGTVANGCYVFFYLTGTSTKSNTYSDAALTVANTNPVLLNSAGRADIFLNPAVVYKVILATPTTLDPPVGADIIKTIDGISAVTVATQSTVVPTVAGASFSAGDWIYMSDGSGALTAGRWYKGDATNTYSSTLANEIGISQSTLTVGQSGTALTVGRSVLVSGTVVAGTVYYLSATPGLITSTAPTNARAVCQADTTTSVILDQWQRTKDASGTTAGLVALGAQTLGTGLKSVQAGSATSALVTIGGILSANITAQSFATGLGGGTLMSYTLPANSLTASGKGIRIKSWGTFAANANSKSVFLSFGHSGATTVVDSTAQTFNGKSWEFECWIFRTTSSANQKSFGKFTPSNPDATYNITETVTVETQDLTIDNEIRTGTTGTSNGDVVQQGMIVELLA